MIRLHTYVFFTSLVLLISINTVSAQTKENAISTSIEASDTVSSVKKQYFELRVGTDLSKLIRSVIEDGYSGFELNADLRFKKNYFAAAEIGTRTVVSTEYPNINNTTAGSYIKAGFNYNAYENWFGMNNIIYAGLRAGFSTFNQDLTGYSIYTTDPIFGDDIRTENREFNGLNATWLEFQGGLQVELFANIYLGIHVQLKRSITVKEPEGFTTFFIPGFGKTTEGSAFGAGYGYTISYLIPIYRR